MPTNQHTRSFATSPAKLLGYSVLAWPLAFAGIPMYLHAPEFYAIQTPMSLTDIALALLCARSIDAIQDPIIGQISDAHSKHRHHMIYLGLLAMMLGFWTLFHPWPQHLWLSLTLSLIVCTSGYSLASINYLALGLWPFEHQRTQITGCREAFGLIGVMLASALPTWLSDKLQHLTQLYASFSLF